MTFRLLLSLIFLFGSSTLLSAQKDSTAKVFEPFLEIGVHYHYTQVGVTFQTPTYETDPLTGFVVGLSLRQQAEKIFGFQLELSYARRGWVESFDTLVGNYERELQYIQITPMTQISIGNSFYFFLNVGPYFAIPLSETENAPTGLSLTDDNARFYYGQELPRRLQYGLVGGPGIGLQLGSLSIQIEGRYLQGFNGVFPSDLLTANSSFPNGFTVGGNLFYRF